MRIKKVVIPLMLIMTMAFPVVANAMPRKLVTLDGGKNYVMQHMCNWCWVAAGVNIFVAIDKDVPTNKSEEDFLLDMAKYAVDNSDRIEPFPDSPGASDLGRYNVEAGLTETAVIANKLFRENRYPQLYYKVIKTKQGKAVVKDFEWLLDDLIRGCSNAIWLSPTANTPDEFDSNHIVLLNGADSDWDDPIDYDVRVFEPNRGSNIWVIYDQLIDGSYSKLKYRRYEGTCGIDN